MSVLDRRAALRAAGVAALAGGATLAGVRPAEAVDQTIIVGSNQYDGTVTLSSTSQTGTAVDISCPSTRTGVNVVAAEGTGVHSSSYFGHAGWFQSGTGVAALRLQGGIRHDLPTKVGAPTSNEYLVGHHHRDKNGDLYLKTTAGWEKAGTLRAGYSGGVQHQLARPIRLLDTRPGKTAQHAGGGPYAAGSTHSLVVAGITYDGQKIPADASAIIGNLTVANPTGHGYVILYPGDANPVPVVSNLNFEKGVNLANAFTLTVGAAKNIKIFISGSATDVLLDVSAFIA